MRFVTSLLFALACGCSTYAVGAIVWSIYDPQGAGTVLLFTIPLAFAAAVVLALSSLIAAMSCGVWNEMTHHHFRRPRTDRPTTTVGHPDMNFAS